MNKTYYYYISEKIISEAKAFTFNVYQQTRLLLIPDHGYNRQKEN